jgi:hypothetical protein
LPSIPLLRGLHTCPEPGAIHSKDLIVKGKPEVIQVLREALTDELGEVHGYILHAEKLMERI